MYHRTEIHSKRFPTVGALGDKIGRDFHVFLRIHHTVDDFFVLVGVGAARCTALKQPIISLCIKKALLIKAGFLKLVVYIGCDNEIVFLPDKGQKIVVHAFWCSRISDISKRKGARRRLDSAVLLFDWVEKTARFIEQEKISLRSSFFPLSGIFRTPYLLVIKVVHDHGMAGCCPTVRQFVVHKGTVILCR